MQKLRAALVLAAVCLLFDEETPLGEGDVDVCGAVQEVADAQATAAAT